MTLWRSPFNAEVYERFVRERGVYAWLNRRLVEAADLAGARRVLDVGCGTGATARACLSALPPDGEVVSVDASPAMVELARLEPDPRARAEVLPAAEVHTLPGRFDRVVSNAALWQVPNVGSVMAALSACTEPGARVVFNLPAEALEGYAAPHPFRAALTDELLAAGARSVDLPTARSIAPETLRALAEEQGFAFSSQRLVYRCAQGELIDLMAIPALLEQLAPALSVTEREAAWRQAAGRCDPALEVAVPWVYVVLTRG